jgi:tRNA modification GTPase
MTTNTNEPQNRRATARLITPPGQAGIAVIQLAGKDALRIIQYLFNSKNFSRQDSPKSEKLYFGRFIDGREIIDDVIVACRSTDSNEWRAEINCHGGLRVTERILAALAAQGARVVRDDRSVDLTWSGPSRFEIETLELAAEMPTRRLAKWVLHQRSALPELVARLTDHLERVDTGPVTDELDKLLARRPQTKLLLRSIKIALVGPPNAGKSTLINALSGLKGSIVSDRPGTTRDWVEHRAAIDGIPVSYVDTAGITTPQDDIDRQAMARARDQAAAADLRLLLLDQSAALPSDLNDLAKALTPPCITVLNKIDRPTRWSTELLNNLPGLSYPTPLPVSGLEKTVLIPLTQAIRSALGLADFQDQAPVLLTDDQFNWAQNARNALPQTPKIAAQYVQKLIS